MRGGCRCQSSPAPGQEIAKRKRGRERSDGAPSARMGVPQPLSHQVRHEDHGGGARWGQCTRHKGKGINGTGEGGESVESIDNLAPETIQHGRIRKICGKLHCIYYNGAAVVRCRGEVCTTRQQHGTGDLWGTRKRTDAHAGCDCQHDETDSPRKSRLIVTDGRVHHERPDRRSAEGTRKWQCLACSRELVPVHRRVRPGTCNHNPHVLG